MQTIKDSIKTIIVSLVTLSLISVAFAWTEPASNPPAGNTNPPITTASNTQTKAGWLTVDNIETYGNTYLSTIAGNVGIGTTTPGATYKLDVVGGAINTTGGLYVSGTRKDTVWDGKQDAIAAGTTSQYWRGDKTWQTPTTSQVTEGANLYFTDARAQAAVQTQLNAKAPTANPTFTGNIYFPGGVWNGASQVGIGTTAPGSYMLNVQSGSGAILGQSSGSGSSGVYGYNSGSGYGGYFSSAAGYALVTLSGKVGIGTTTPSYLFEVSGGTTYLRANNPNANALYVRENVQIDGRIRGATYGFGGMYKTLATNGACSVTNILSGFCSCPTGFTAALINQQNISGVNFREYYCWK